MTNFIYIRVCLCFRHASQHRAPKSAEDSLADPACGASQASEEAVAQTQALALRLAIRTIQAQV